MEGRDSMEELLLKQIISSAELILDDIDNGASVSEASFNLLGFIDASMNLIQKDVCQKLTPTNIMTDQQALFESTGGRIYSDDEHGNFL